jgi:ABC-type polysaccharide/polyol phosphate export permease
MLNPLSVPVELVRDVAAFGAWPSPGLAAASFVVSWAIAWIGLAFFTRLRGVFADVV